MDRRGTSSMTPEELAEWAAVPGNERVAQSLRRAETAARPSPVRPQRVCVRLAPPEGVPMLAGVTVAVFAETHDREMAESVAEAVLHKMGLKGEVIDA